MLRVLINLEPPTAPHRTLAEICAVNVSGPGRMSQDYIWRVRSINVRQKMSVQYGSLADQTHDSSTGLLQAILEQAKTGEQFCSDHHGQMKNFTDDYEAFWKKADPNPVEIG